MGKEAEKRELDAEVERVRVRYREVRATPDPRTAQQEAEWGEAKAELKRVAKRRRRILRGWEEAWWIDLGKQASAAAENHDSGELYRVLRTLRVRGDGAVASAMKHTVANPEGDREAWASHFRRISETRGQVAERVWGNVPRVAQTRCEWLGAPPGDIELWKAVAAMRTGKAAGEDGLMAEALKFGGERQRGIAYRIVRKMWASAARAELGGEADDWPEEWRVGITVPLWKRKGSKADKNTWRGITLLSVGSKLLARVVAARLQRWYEPWAHEAQCGFRKGRGVDDALQTSRRIVEEVMRSQGDQWYKMVFLDIEQACPRVCKDALWEVMRKDRLR